MSARPSRTTLLEILTPEALRFVAGLQRAFNPRRKELLARRQERQARFDAGELPDFLPETESDPRRRLAGRAAAGRPAGSARRDHRPGRSQDGDQRAELGRQLLHGRLRGFALADLGRHARRPDQSARRDQRRRSSTCSRRRGKQYTLNPQVATLHRSSARLAPGGEARAGRRPADVGLAVRLWPVLLPQRPAAARQGHAGPTSTCPSWRATSKRGSGTTSSSRPSKTRGLPQGTIRATVLIETILAAFEMDEILYELRDHIGRAELRPLGLHLQLHQALPQPTRDGAARPRPGHHDDALHARSYSLLAIKTCHRRGASAIGGMAAQIPIKDDPAANEQAMEKVARRQAARSAATATTAPGSRTRAWSQLAEEEFDAVMKTPNQIDRQRDDVQVTAEDLLQVPDGHDHRRGPAAEHPRGRAVHGGLAAAATAASRSTT